MISYRQSQELGHLYIQQFFNRCQSFFYPIKDIQKILTEKSIKDLEVVGSNIWKGTLNQSHLKEKNVFLINQLALKGRLEDIFSPYLKKKNIIILEEIPTNFIHRFQKYLQFYLKYGFAPYRWEKEKVLEFLKKNHFKVEVLSLQRHSTPFMFIIASQTEK